MGLWTDNVDSPLRHSLFALFSPKLWTVLNQYGAGGPCIMGLHEWRPGHRVRKAIAYPIGIPATGAFHSGIHVRISLARPPDYFLACSASASRPALVMCTRAISST